MVIYTALCLLLDPTSAIEASPIVPLVFFCYGAALAPLQYTREYLLNLQYGPNILSPNLESDIPNIVNNKKKRGSRGGARNRLKKSGYRPPLPAITLSNVRYLQNKMDELSTLITYDSDYRRSSQLCFTETWLTENATDIGFDDYTTIRFNRSKKKTDKSIGEGLCMMVNNKWATNVCIRERVGTRSYEILTVSFRPKIPLWYAGIAVPQVLQYLREFDAPAMQSCKPLPCGIGSCQNRRLREQTLTRKPCHCGSIKGG